SDALDMAEALHQCALELLADRQAESVVWKLNENFQALIDNYLFRQPAADLSKLIPELKKKLTMTLGQDDLNALQHLFFKQQLNGNDSSWLSIQNAAHWTYADLERAGIPIQG